MTNLDCHNDAGTILNLVNDAVRTLTNSVSLLIRKFLTPIGTRVYCDESCHLEHDRQTVMVLGAIWCPIEKARETAQAIQAIKEKHGLGYDFEIKWTKASPGKIASYIEQINGCCLQKNVLSPLSAGG